jgi:hypothetical protein
MRPDHDFDAFFLLAMSLAAKRRPAELVEIIAAIDLAQGAIPAAAKLSNAFYRLSQFGLICEQDGGYALTPYALNILSGQKKSAKNEERILAIKQQLTECRVKSTPALIQLTTDQLAKVVKEYKDSKIVPVKNMLTKPKPPEGTDKRLIRRKSNQSFAARQRKR